MSTGYEHEVCLSADDGHHTWVRRRDGKECVECGRRKFGVSTLTDDEIIRLVEKAQVERDSR